jgi:O-antigen ligase
VKAASNPGLNWYLLFVVSWFLHLPARVPVLGVFRIDLLLVIILAVLALAKKTDDDSPKTGTDKLLKILIAYSVLTIPFTEWPGSVIKAGLPNLIKAVVFYYFTVAFVRTEPDLRRFIFVFIVCQIVRILEPLYLNLTQDYWGSGASMLGGSEFLDRLSGSPYDVVNPNGLGAVICIVLPFLYFMQGLSWKHRLVFVVLTPPLLYALMLTGSRSGLIALLIIFGAILVKSKKRLLLLVCGIVAVGVGFSSLSPDMQDRYLSTFGLGEKNVATAEERAEGLAGQFHVALRRPLFGHGLGTSAEANFHFNESGPYAGLALPAHNLYLELAQEIGLVGLVIFVLLMKSIVSEFIGNQRERSGDQEVGAFLPRFIDAMQVWIIMNIVFSFASYGLSSYDWYLFGGVSVVLQRLRRYNAVQPPDENTRTVRGGSGRTDAHQV